MISEGIVIKTNGDKAIVNFKRQSACGGNCGACAGCSGNEIKAEAENKIGAKEGDFVIVESETTGVLKTAFLVYICPLIAFLASYFVLAQYLTEDKSAFFSVLVFAACWLALKKADGKTNLAVRIVKITKTSGETL